MLRLKSRHKIMCGDSTDENDVAKLMAGEKAVFCFTSPPYSDQRDYRGDLKLSTKHLAKFLNAPCDLFAVNLGMQRKNNEVYPYWDDYISHAKSRDLKFLSWNIWNRNECGSIGNQSAMFGISHEWILVFGKKKKLNLTNPNNSVGQYSGKKRSNRQKDGSLKVTYSEGVRKYRQLDTVINIKMEKSRNHGCSHPAMFPVELPEKYIEACSDSGEVIYEPFTGSGSTLIACEKTNRTCYGMEIDEHYMSVIIKRWEDYTGQKAERIEECQVED